MPTRASRGRHACSVVLLPPPFSRGLAENQALKLLQGKGSFNSQSGKDFLDTGGWNLNLHWICIEIQHIVSIVDIIISGKISEELWHISIDGILEIKNRKE